MEQELKNKFVKGTESWWKFKIILSLIISPIIGLLLILRWMQYGLPVGGKIGLIFLTFYFLVCLYVHKNKKYL